ncbi:putative Thioredoxin-like superfamily [Helianthus debilis subsp. tardiflorus]
MTLLIVQLRLYAALYRQVLWDKKLKTIVNNESEEIIRMLNTECNEIEENPSLESPEFNRTPSTCTALWI